MDNRLVTKLGVKRRQRQSENNIPQSELILSSTKNNINKRFRKSEET